MKLTEQTLRNIIKEELQNILNEKTITMGNLDLIFQSKDKVQLVSNTGRTGLTRMDATQIVNGIKRVIGGVY